MNRRPGRCAPAALAAIALAATVSRGARADEPRPEGVRSWYALPVVFWLPETRLGFGGLAGLHLGFAEGLDTSSVEVIVYGTLERQSTLRTTWELFPRDGLAIVGEARLANAPDRFYGIGPAADGPEERFTGRVATIESAFQRRLGRSAFRIGPKVDLHREVVVDEDPGGVLAAGSVPGSEAFTAAGAGLSATFDDRDSLFQPQRGRRIEAWYLAYRSSGGVDGWFGRGSLEARLFTPLFPRHVLAWSGRVEVAHGAVVPFTLLPRIGSPWFLRGIREGRWRDRLAWTAQGEYRFPLWGRLRGALFAGAGAVAPSVGELRLGDTHGAAGAGLRFFLTKDGAVIRADVAVGPGGMQVYLITLEAF